MNFYIHIGTHKTGSTALQYFLLKNRLILKEKGFWYPQAGSKDAGHHEIAWASRKNDDQPKLIEMLKQVRREARRNKCENIILSSEEFEFVKDINNLKLVLGEHHCKIILYLRRQDALLESEYNQHVKQANTQYRQSIFKFCFDFDFSSRFNYRNICSLWGQKFSDQAISVINYDNCSKDPLGIFSEFLNILEMELNNNFILPETKNSNLSLPSQATIYLARLNRLSLTNIQRQTAMQFLSNEFNGKNCSLLSLADRKKLWGRYRISNRYVETHYKFKPFCEPVDTDQQYVDFCEDFDTEIYNKIVNEILK